jgi:aryl-alcohol dehydrogenase-like predicted oxidoreductase
MFEGKTRFSDWDKWTLLPLLNQERVRLLAQSHHQKGLLFEQLKKMQPGIDPSDRNQEDPLGVTAMYHELVDERNMIHEETKKWKGPLRMRGSLTPLTYYYYGP